MKAAFDDIMETAVTHQHELQRVVAVQTFDQTAASSIWRAGIVPRWNVRWALPGVRGQSDWLCIAKASDRRWQVG